MTKDIAFQNRIYAIACSIPRGKVTTYGQLAALAGRPRGARAAGMCMRHCRAAEVPCHRVVFHDGSICRGDAFGGMPEMQKQLLLNEGVIILKNGKVDLRACGWNGAHS